MEVVCSELPRTSHVCKLFTSTLQVIAVLGLDGVLNGAGHRVINTQNRALNQLDLTGCISTQIPTAGSISTSRGLSLAPGLRGGGLTAGVRGGHPARDPKSRCRAFRLTRVNRTCRIRIVISGCCVGGIGLGQAVTRSGANGRNAARMRVVKWSCKRALLMGEKSSRGILILPILFPMSVIDQNKEPNQAVLESWAHPASDGPHRNRASGRETLDRP